MKIVQLIPELNEGGVERGVVELNREYVKLGIDSTIISNGGKLVEQIEKDGGVHIKYDVCSKNIFTLPFRIIALRTILKKLKPDIIHARSRVPAWIAYFANKKLGIKFVTTVHGLNSINKYSEIMTKGDEIICVSEVVKKYIIKNYNLSKKNISIIQRGVDLNKFNCENIDKSFIEEFKIKYDLKNKYIISSVGRVTWLKDYETFIKSIFIVKKHIPNVIALIVGGVHEDKNDYFLTLKKLVNELDLQKNIIFTGSQSKIAEIYFLSDIVVNASIKMGNVGRTIVESLALNTPVIATTYKGLNNIIVEDVNGAIIDVKNEKQLSEKILKIRNKKFINLVDTIPYEFTLDCMVKSTVEIYKKMMKRN